MLKLNKIKKLMQKKGITQADLADAVDVQQSYISLILGGKREPAPGVFKKIATVLGVTMEELVDERR